MKKIFLIEDTLANKISYWLLLLFLAFLPFDRAYTEVIFLAFALHTLIQADWHSWKRMFTKKVLVLQAVYILFALCIFYSSYRDQALDDSTRQLAIFFFPLLFSLTRLGIAKYRERLLLAFGLVCTAIIVYLFADAVYIIHYYQLPFSSLFSISFTNHNFSEPIDMHATYLSMYMSVALVNFLYLLSRGNTGRNKIFYSICCLILVVGLIQLGSKSVVIAVLLIVNLAFPLFALQGNKKIQFIVISLAISALAFAAILYSDTYKDRYVKEMKEELKTVFVAEKAEEPRMIRWEVALGLIRKRPVIGYGSGSEIPLLKEKYYEKKLYNSYLNELNTHNQYLSFSLKTGVVGLLVYLFTLWFGFSNAMKRRDTVFLAL